MEHIESLREGQEANFEKLKGDFISILEKNQMTKANATNPTQQQLNAVASSGRKTLAD